jgi:hypothetical protein
MGLKKQKRLFSVFIYKYCYEILLLALLFHLFGSAGFFDLKLYEKYFRLANVILVYLAATNSFFHRKIKITPLFILFLLFSFCCSTGLFYLNDYIPLEYLREISFLLFLIITIYYTFSFLLSPHRIDMALISGTIVGYLLLIEIAVRIFLILLLIDGTQVLTNIDLENHTSIYVDLVYYCTNTATSIGFSNMLPISQNAKMITSLLALAGQFYLVIIMSMMIRKFTSKKL